MKKRFLAALLAFCMVLTLLPSAAFAADSDFTIENGVLTKYNGSGGDVTIPSNVTSIGHQAFYNCRNLTNVTIPSGVTSIGTYAFDGCSSLTDVAIPTTVTSIGSYAFNYCTSLTNVTIPVGVTSIGEGVFQRCSSLTDVTIPTTVTSIGSYAFNYCTSLTSVTIPVGVTSIGKYAFSDCAGLTIVTIPSSVTSIGSHAFYSCNNLSDVTIPFGVIGIGDYAFYRCVSLTSVTIPSTVTKIGEAAFALCTGLTDATISSSVTNIESGTFFGCSHLASVTIPSSVTSIGGHAFLSCDRLRDVYYGGDENEWAQVNIYDENSDLLNATIHYNSTGPDGQGSAGENKTINGILRSGEGWNIRWECSYSLDTNGNPCNGRVEITASESNEKEELYLYNDASADGFPWELAPYSIPKSAITSLLIQGSITKKLRITANSFTGYDSLKSVGLLGVSGIDTNAFYGCAKLEQLVLDSSTLTHIGNGAFKNCTSLSNVDFPDALTNIGAEAFQNTALGDITLGQNLEGIGDKAFAGCNDLLIWCYENSTAHRYAVENNIPFQLINENPYSVEIPWGGETPEVFEHNLDYLIMHTSSTTYSPELSHMLIALCNSVHNAGIMSEAMTACGFQKNNRYSLEFITFNIGRKQLSDGTVLILVVVRGTVDGAEWVSNFDVFQNASALHKGFADAADEIYRKLIQDVLEVGENLANVKFVITGHSRGAAAANLLEYKLHGMGISKENLYGYNFACPDVAVRYSSEWNPSGKYNNMFNLGNAPDPVPLVPGVIGTGITVHLPGASWGKFGQSLWFSDSWNNLDENGGTLRFSAHFQDRYLEILRRRPPIVSFKTWWDVKTNVVATQVETIGKLFSFCCPVDVIIKDEDGNPVASVINGVGNYYTAEFGKVTILTDEDRKAIFVQGNEPLTVHLTATDSGTMEYVVQTVDWWQDAALSEKVFSDVALVNGKQMTSMTDVENITGVGTDVSRVPLYVLGDDGQPALKVLPDGKGTEVPLDAPDAIYTISFDTAVVSIEVPPMKTQANGKLSSLPKPTRSGYNFNGWFTAASGGNQITTETIFDRNTTVYAHWIYVGGGTSNDPSSSPSSGGGYASPTYSITVPTLTGGTIAINPKFAQKGATVTITATPDAGYKLASVTVSDSSGKAITLTDKGNGKYTFTMPSGKVTVSATFQPDQILWSNPFIDIAGGEWYYEAVRFVQENGLMSGYGNGTFAPNANLSRAMLAQILYNKEGHPAVSGNAFIDVVEGAWYADAVTWAAAQGIVNGYGKGLFGPNDNITREQLAVMLWRYAGEPAATDKELRFNDADSASDFALDALCWTTENGIISGKGGGILDPRGQATRAEVAQILMNYLKK